MRGQQGRELKVRVGKQRQGKGLRQRRRTEDKEKEISRGRKENARLERQGQLGKRQ